MDLLLKGIKDFSELKENQIQKKRSLSSDCLIVIFFCIISFPKYSTSTGSIRSCRFLRIYTCTNDGSMLDKVKVCHPSRDWE